MSLNDEQLLLLARMALESGGLDDPSACDPRRADCLSMARHQALASGLAATARETAHLTGCALCCARQRAFERSVVRAPTRPARGRALPRWLAAGAGMAAAVAGLAFWMLTPSSKVATLPLQLAVRLELDPACIGGDANCDGVLSECDIDPFMIAVSSLEQYTNEFPHCDALCTNDVNHDGVVDERDIEPFLVCLLGPDSA